MDTRMSVKPKAEQFAIDERVIVHGHVDFRLRFIF